MKAKLISNRHGEFVIAGDATIGRSDDNSICIQASVVSTQHARITFDGEAARYVIEDLGSLNGTEVDGMRVDRPEPLGSLSMVCFGGSEKFIFQTLSSEAGGEADTIEIPPVDKTQADGEVPVLPEALREGPADVEAGPKKKATKKPAATKKAADAGDEKDTGEAGGTLIEKDVVPVPEVLAEASQAAQAQGKTESSEASSARRLWLEFALEGGAQRFELVEGENLVGRGQAAAVRLDYPDLSRSHATVTLSGGKVTVHDEGSRNHTYVGGAKVDPEAGTEVEVTVGETIVFGRLESRLIEDG